jgi:hypothetical protein
MVESGERMQIPAQLKEPKVIIPVAGATAVGLFLISHLAKKAPAGQGASATTGVAGTTRQPDGSAGVIGYAGDSPPQVIQGGIGPAGPAGAKGEVGDRGLRGLRGLTGATGPAGAKLPSTPPASVGKPYHCPAGSVLTKEHGGTGNDVCEKPNGTQFQVIKNGAAGEGTPNWNHVEHYYGKRAGGFHPALGSL